MLKALPPGNYLIRPFKTHKSNSYSYTYSGSNNVQFVSIDEAIPPPNVWYWSGSSEPINISGLPKRSLYESVEQMFYLTTSMSAYIPAFNWTPTNNPNGCYVINIASTSYGEQIRPGTFKLVGSAGTGSIYDDGEGRLLWDQDPTAPPLGNIFYPLGIAVVGKLLSTTGSIFNNQGIFLFSGSQIEVDYESQWTIYEYTAICTLEAGEFNWTTNQTLNFPSSSVTGSESLISSMLSGSLNPYVTTINLADDVGNVLVTAKVPRPIKRRPEMGQTFILKWDV